MLKCREISHLIATDAYGDLGFMKRLELRMHLMMCRHCLGYFKQMQASGNGARRLMGKDEPTAEELSRLEREICAKICHQDGSGSN